MKGKLGFAGLLAGSENRIVRGMWDRIREAGGGCSWGREIGRCMGVVGVEWNELGVISKGEIVGRVNDWELNRWREEVSSKSTLSFYRAKESIGGEGGYDNSWGSVLLYRVRSNSLRLGWRERFFGGEVAYVMCGAEEETLLHFLEEFEGCKGKVWFVQGGRGA